MGRNHDAEEILRNTYQAASEVIANSGINPADVLSVAVTNQRETVVVWDKRTGKPVCHAVVWQCNRGAGICEKLVADGQEPMVRNKTGLLLNPYFSASGIQWILDNVPGARENAEAGQLLFGTVDTWLIWNFTQGTVHATDYTNASRTLLFNIHTLKFDPELLNLFHIPLSMAPEPMPCDRIFGTTTLNGLLPVTPIAGVLGDSHGALAGQMCFSKGMGKATYGTGSSIMLPFSVNLTVQPSWMVNVELTLRAQSMIWVEPASHIVGVAMMLLSVPMTLPSPPSGSVVVPSHPAKPVTQKTTKDKSSIGLM